MYYAVRPEKLKIICLSITFKARDSNTVEFCCSRSLTVPSTQFIVQDNYAVGKKSHYSTGLFACMFPRVPECQLGATFEGSSCQLRVDGPDSSTALGPAECGAVRW